MMDWLGRRWWLVGLMLFCSWAIYHLIFERSTIRVRMTVAVEVDGQPRTGSSVIEVDYPPRDLGGGPSDLSINVRGTAPIVDLGPHGTLVAALEPYSGGRAIDWIGGSGSRISSLVLLAFGVRYWQVHTVRHEVTLDRLMPQFVWVPPGSVSGLDAVPLRAWELSTVSGTKAGPIEVSMAPTRDPVKTRVDPAPDWLITIRKREAKNVGPNWTPICRDSTCFKFMTLAIERSR